LHEVKSRAATIIEPYAAECSVPEDSQLRVKRIDFFITVNKL
jgi:hypothetical protein